MAKTLFTGRDRNAPSIKYSLSLLILLLLIPIFSITSMRQKSATFDEITHLPSGYSYIVERDYRMNPEHPPLIKILSAIPLLFLELKPPHTFPGWKIDNRRLAQWIVGKEFLYHNIEDADTILFWGRIPIVLLSIIIGIIVFLWARGLYGTKSGLFALLLYVMEPNILAHSRLVTTDIGITLFFFLTFFSFWKLFQTLNLSYLLLLSISIGLALASKFSAVIIFPILGILSIIQIVIKDEGLKGSTIGSYYNSMTFLKRLIYLFLASIIVLLLSSIILGMTYQFTHIRGFLDGLNMTIKHSIGGHNSYLFGEYSMKGWRYYFPIAFMLKTPIPLIIFLIITIVISLKRGKREVINELSLTLPPLIYLLLSLFNHINIGLRHLLPIYPFIFVYVSGMLLKGREIGELRGIFRRKISKRIFSACILLLLCWYIYSSLKIYPDYLAYFNEFAGGPDNGYLYLADSNIDWGQDLKGLKRYMVENNIDEIILSYFGNADPSYYNIRYQRLYPYTGPSKGYILRSKERETLAVSVNCLLGIYFPNTGYFSWLSDLRPIAKVGYSIFIYDITDNPRAHFHLGYNSIEARLYDEAIREFKRVLELRSDVSGEAHTGLGLAYFYKKMYDRAEEEYKMALEGNPTTSEPYRNLGSLYYELKRYKDALEIFSQALSINPNDKISQEFIKKIQIRPLPPKKE